MPIRGSPGPTEFTNYPQTQASKILWVQEKEPRYYCISNSPVNKPSFRFPKGASTERIARFQSPLLHISQALLLPSLKVPNKWSPTRPPKGASIERGACFQSLPLPILQVPHYKSPPLVSPHRTSTERDALFPQPSPQNEPPPFSPMGVPTQRDARFQSLLLRVSRIPQHKFFW